MLYLIILLIILCCTYQFDLKRKRQKKWIFYWSICIIFILLSGFRYHIGIDPLIYENNWNRYPEFWDFNWSKDIEKFRSIPETERYRTGWIIYVMIIQIFSKEFFVCQIVNAILINLAIFRLVKKYTTHPFTVILIYYGSFTFVEFNFELMRETVAVSLFLLWAFEYYLKQKWIKYYLVVLCAYQIHPSAMMMFVLPFIRNLKLTNIQYTIFFIVPSVIIGLLGRVFLGDFLNILLGDKAYAAEYFSRVPESNLNYFFMYAFKPTLLLGLYLCFSKYVTQKQLIPIFFFSIFFMYISTLVYTAARFTNYIIIIDYIIIGDILVSLAKKFKTIIIMPIYLTMLYIPNIYQYTNPTTLARHYPYRCIFYNKPTQMQKIMERDAYRNIR